MKNFYLTLAMTCLCLSTHTLLAQKYLVQAKAFIRNDVHAATCNSNFNVKFLNKSNATVADWSETIAVGEDQSISLSTQFIVDGTNLITSIQVTAKRYYWNSDGWSSWCKLAEGQNPAPMSFPTYPCDTKTYKSVFKSYSRESWLEITVAPLSPASDNEAIEMQSMFDLIEGNYVRYQVAVSFTDNTTIQVYDREPQQNTLITKAVLVPKGKRISSITITARGQKKTFTVSDTRSEFSFEKSDLGISNFTPHAYISLKRTRPKTKLTGPASVNNEEPFRLKAEGIYGTRFSWQFSSDYGASWNSVGNTTILLFVSSAKALLGDKYTSYFFQNILFKAEYECAPSMETEVIPVKFIPSAPAIQSTSYEQEKCAGSGDGKLYIVFARPPLKVKIGNDLVEEKLSIFLNNTLYASTRVMEDDPRYAGRQVYKIENLPPGSYQISLLTKFASENGYTEGPDHKATQVIPPRPPITNFNIESTSTVHCFGGKDGTIQMSALGGTQTFNASLLKDSKEIQTLRFVQPEKANFSGVSAGNYQIKIKDSNGCEPVERGRVIVRNASITQPAEPVKLILDELIEPLAFEQHNGMIRVRYSGGTGNITSTWTNNAGEPVPNKASIFNSAYYTQESDLIPSGLYRVRVQDDQFNSASGEENQRGCFDQLEIFLPQPPLLEADVAVVSTLRCFGDKDGSLTVNATGGRPFASPDEPYRYEWYLVRDGMPDLTIGTSPKMNGLPAGSYRVKITDKNGISVQSSSATLNEPDAIGITIHANHINCDGESNGKLAADVKGGTAPYQYVWNTNERTAIIENLAEGNYDVTVTDAMNCKAGAEAEIIVPSGIKVEAMLTNPTCDQGKDGTIELAVTGGTPGYEYFWGEATGTSRLVSLQAGSYHVKIKDANQCFIERTFTLKNPVVLNLATISNRTLCEGQRGTFDATNPEIAQYQWTSNGTILSTRPKVEFEQPGSYELSVKTVKGCESKTKFDIIRSTEKISSNFAAASYAPVGEPFTITNISFPLPDDVSWIIPPMDVNVIQQSTDHLQLIFEKKGTFEIGMLTKRKGCDKTEFQSVNVVDRSELPLNYQSSVEPLIKQFYVSPNPSDGNFSCTIELSKPSRFQLRLLSMMGDPILIQEYNKVDFVRSEMDVREKVSRGVYVLQLILQDELAFYKLIVK